MYDLIPRRESSTVATRNIGIGYSSTDDPARERFFELRRRERLGLINLLDGNLSGASSYAGTGQQPKPAPICKKDREDRACLHCKMPLDPSEHGRRTIHTYCRLDRKKAVMNAYNKRRAAAKKEAK